MTAKKIESRQSFAEVAGEALSQDTELQREVKALIRDLLRDVRYTITWGNQSDRASLQKSVLPALVKSMTRVEDDQNQQRQRDAYDEVRKMVGGDPL